MTGAQRACHTFTWREISRRCSRDTVFFSKRSCEPRINESGGPVCVSSFSWRWLMSFVDACELRLNCRHMPRDTKVGYVGVSIPNRCLPGPTRPRLAFLSLFCPLAQLSHRTVFFHGLVSRSRRLRLITSLSPYTNVWDSLDNKTPRWRIWFVHLRYFHISYHRHGAGLWLPAKPWGQNSVHTFWNSTFCVSVFNVTLSTTILALFGWQQCLHLHSPSPSHFFVFLFPALEYTWAFRHSPTERAALHVTWLLCQMLSRA